MDICMKEYTEDDFITIDKNRKKLAEYENGGYMCLDTLTQEVTELHSKVDNLNARFDGFVRDLIEVLMKYTENNKQLVAFNAKIAEKRKQRSIKQQNKYLGSLTEQATKK